MRQFSYSPSPHIRFPRLNNALWRNAMGMSQSRGIAATWQIFPELSAPSLPKLLFGLDLSEWLRFKLFRVNHHKTFWTAPVISP
jgi:hypothetical protein